MPQLDETRTYRVRQLPCVLIYRRQVASFLASIVADLEVEHVHVFSLAPSLNPLELPPTKVATVMFSKTPTAFDSANSHDHQWTISGRPAGLQKDVIVDVHFEGFTPLNDVAGDEHTLE